MKTKTYLSIKTLLIVIALFTNSFLSSCTNELNQVKLTLDEMETRYENIAEELGTAYWNYYSKEADADLKAPKDKFYTLLINDTLNNIIESWYPKASEIQDTMLRRRIETWHRVLLIAKVEYDEEIMALRNELEEKLEVGEDAGDYNIQENMLNLIKLRNKKSVELGYENYAHLTFETNGLGYEWFMQFIDKLEQETREPYKKLVDEIKVNKGLKEFGQMDAFLLIRQFYGNNRPAKLKDTSNIELVKKSLANIGINYAHLPSKLVEMQLPAGIGGQGLMINIPNDFRAVTTIGMEISTWMHEMGHGLHGLYNTIGQPILEGYEWIPGNATAVFAEGMAETSAYFTRNPEWLLEYTDLTEEEILERRQIINKHAPSFIRYHLYSFMSEIELYTNPDKSFESIQKELAKKYNMVESEEFRARGLNSVVYVSYPLYMQGYLFADIIASQIHTTLEQEFGNEYAFNKEVGNYLAKYFYSTGEYYTWNERLKKGTGKELDLAAYLEYYNIK